MNKLWKVGLIMVCAAIIIGIGLVIVPEPSSVKPDLVYNKEPAPMGIADYGINPTTGVQSSSLSTTSFIGIVSISTLNAMSNDVPGTSIQLNTILKFTTGDSTFAYFLQNSVIIFDDLGKNLQVEDVITNVSSSGAGITGTGISGGGGIFHGPPNYYGNAVVINHSAYPYTLKFQINSTTVAGGQPKIIFSYWDGQWVTYDQVTFLTTSSINDNLVIDGSQYTPSGNYYDAEFVLCGLGNGASATIIRANLTLSMEYLNGSNYQSPQTFYNFELEYRRDCFQCSYPINRMRARCYLHELVRGTRVINSND